MIPKTPDEKQALKAAKSAHKASVREYEKDRSEAKKEPSKRQTILATGILPSERILEMSFPVYFDYMYVIDDHGGMVIKSDIEGTIANLKMDLRKKGYKAENVYTCDILKRTIV